MPLVLQVRYDGDDAIIVEHAGERLLIAVKPHGENRAKIVIHGPPSFVATCGGSISEAIQARKLLRAHSNSP